MIILANKIVQLKNNDDLFFPISCKKVTNVNGTAIKFADGTMICTKKLTGKTTNTLWYEKIYYSDIWWGTLAGSFQEIYSIMATCDSQYWCSVNEQGCVRLLRESKVTDYNYTIYLTIIGRWK